MSEVYVHGEDDLSAPYPALSNAEVAATELRLHAAQAPSASNVQS